MKYQLHNSKVNNFLKPYLLIFSFLNFLYVFLELYNFKLKEIFSSLGNSLFLIKETYPVEFARSANICKTNAIIYHLIIGINLFYLIVLISKKYKTKFNIDVKKCLTIHFIYLIVIFLINYILSIIFSAPIGNLNVQLLPACEIILILLLYYAIKALYGKIKILN